MLTPVFGISRTYRLVSKMKENADHIFDFYFQFSYQKEINKTAIRQCSVCSPQIPKRLAHTTNLQRSDTVKEFAKE